MGVREEHAARLQPLVAEGRYPAIERLLLEGSGLPGPRGNLELAAAFADQFEKPTARDWERLDAWARLESSENDGREYLPFCAVQAMGVAYPAARAGRRARIERELRLAAQDERWRVREAAAMALQRMAEHDFALVRGCVARWLPHAGELEQRAILAGLAHPPVLKQEDAALFALETGEAVLTIFQASAVQKTEPLRVLELGLSYALSVFVAAAPEQGFRFMERWAKEANERGARVLRKNLEKNRLQKHPAQVRSVLNLLGEKPAATTGKAPGGSARRKRS